MAALVAAVSTREEDRHGITLNVRPFGEGRTSARTRSDHRASGRARLDALSAA
jgi:hypothetical protein